MLKYVLLGFLSYFPATGYELKQSMDNSTQYFWNAKQSQVYRTLKQLESEGLLCSHVEAQDERPDRRVYQITDAGRADFNAWLQEPETEVPVKKDALLLKLFFSAPLSNEHLLSELRVQRERHLREYEHLSQHVRQHLAAQKAQTEDPMLARTLLLWEQVRRYGELYFEMYQRWLDETIGVLEANPMNEEE